MGKYFILILLIIASAGCQKSSEPIVFGADQCAFCRMTISDPKYGAELVTEKGRVYKYDAMECMVKYLEDNEVHNGLLLGIAYDEPKKLFPVDSLTFEISKTYRSPMGANLAAFIDPTKNKKPLKWCEINEKLKVD
jgi:copper chaperone NosL